MFIIYHIDWCRIFCPWKCVKSQIKNHLPCFEIITHGKKYLSKVLSLPGFIFAIAMNLPLLSGPIQRHDKSVWRYEYMDMSSIHKMKHFNQEDFFEPPRDLTVPSHAKVPIQPHHNIKRPKRMVAGDAGLKSCRGLEIENRWNKNGNLGSTVVCPSDFLFCMRKNPSIAPVWGNKNKTHLETTVSNLVFLLCPSSAWSHQSAPIEDPTWKYQWVHWWLPINSQLHFQQSREHLIRCLSGQPTRNHIYN